MTDSSDTEDPTDAATMKKSDSEYSLPWDAVLEQAKQRMLAPDAVELVI